MEKIAIQGHRTRYKDVIKILESLGGKNLFNNNGDNTLLFYYVKNNTVINSNYSKNIPKDYKLYTLEEYEQQITRKQIAIQGHPARGNDIIKTLESLGGINGKGYTGYDPCFYYYINTKNFIDCEPDGHLPQEYKKYNLEEYEQIQNNMENKRTIQIDLNTAKEWYKQGGDLRQVALQAFSENELNTLPKSWEEYCNINPYIIPFEEHCLNFDDRVISTPIKNYKRIKNSHFIPSEERAKQFLTLNKLLQIRDYYNQGWKPDWKDDTKKYVIWSLENTLHPSVSIYVNNPFAFKTKKLRNEFLQNFKEDLETIKELL